MQVIVPLKEFDNAKQRLADILTPAQRRDLSRAMVDDVLTVISKHPLVDDVTLLTDDSLALDLARQHQIKLLSENTLNASGLNAALQAAISHISSQLHGSTDIMILHGDLPLISTQEMSLLIEKHQSQSNPTMLIAPDRHGTGTNCLVFPAQSTPTLAFGPNSYSQHCHEAQRLDLQLQKVELMGTKTDIDLPEDLLTLLSAKNLNLAKRSRDFLLNNEIDKQLFNQLDTYATKAAI